MVGEPWDDYGLIDSGDGRKLERYGPYRFIRPEPQAMWAPALDAAAWDADAEFVPASDDDGGGRWYYHRPVPQDGWPLGWHNARFTAQCTPFRHLGFFPDMAPVWSWLRSGMVDVAQPQFLNLFGYTGVGSQALAASGAAVTHVDASKKSVTQARANAALAGIAAKFVAREVRREKRYDAILLDPPKYGRGPDGERWQLETDLAPLLADCRRLMDADSRALFLTVYAVRMSALAIGELVSQLFADLPGTVECGELAVREETRGLTLPTAIFARWSAAAR
jgi:23S rRNA (cytosine1962-C5)-methyltransferase